ncbi:MAG TPA: alkaline phosphatase family protein [Bryobacteraceae bacterium]|nr:alkaline phosphatase family protein [Bryobacteraceae bacterium]
MPSPKVLLVGWDAADWKIIHPMIQRGQMPALSGLIDRGVMADMETLQPVLSPMLWNSIATGKTADEHGILGFTEVDPANGRVRPVTSTSRRVKALWNVLSQEGLRSNVVSWFGGHPAEPIRGTCVSDAYARAFPPAGDTWPTMPGSIWPDRLNEVLSDLRIHPREIDASIIRTFIERAPEIDQSQPNLLHTLTKVLAECFTTHAAATYLMEHEPWDLMAVYYIGIDHFSHAFMNYHPPREDWVPVEHFEMYKDVVTGGYRLMDLFLARLLFLAGPDTTVLVLSDHGFHSDHLRPAQIPDIPAGPATQHRPLGIFTLAGAGIRRDERIYGVNLLDVAPTVLSLFGLPAGEDMPGRVLAEAFENSPDPARIPSWELVEGDSGMHPVGFAMPPSDAERLLQQFIDLGYIDEPKDDIEAAAAECERERKWNLARVYTGGMRYAEALPLLEEIHAQAPERGDYGLALAEAQRRIGLYEEATHSVESAIANHRDTPAAHMILGNIAFEQGRLQEALRELLIAEQADPRLPDLHVSIGFAYLRLRRWNDALRAFSKALEIDPHSASAWHGQAITQLRLGAWEESAASALQSVGIHHGAPRAHFTLGMALLRLGRRERAIQAFETCLTLRPPLRAAHRVLAGIHPDAARAAAHLRKAREFTRDREAQMRRMETLRQEARHRAIDRQEIRESAKAEQAQEETGPALDFTIVSGLPRSGTSLMMQMLAAAGLHLQTDGARVSDPDNPEGYYEWEAVKRVGRRPEILREAAGKVIKVVAPLLGQLPARHTYRVIYMDRPIDEVVKSQRKMIRNRGNRASEDPETMRRLLGNFRDSTLRMLERQKHFHALIVDYPDLVRDPGPWLDRIAAFLNGAVDPGAMASAIRPDLYRNRAIQKV